MRVKIKRNSQTTTRVGYSISKRIGTAVSRNLVKRRLKNIIGDFKLAGNPIKMSTYKDEKTRGATPDLDQERKKIIEEFCN